MSSENPHLLIVSWPVYPARGGSVQIVEKILDGFTDDEVTVVGELSFTGSPPLRPPGSPRVEYFRSGFSLFGRGARFFSWLRWMLFPLLVRKIVRVARRDHSDCILAIFPDDYYSSAGLAAAERLGLRFFTYFHNTYMDNEAVDQRRARDLQPRLFSASEQIFVMSEGMRQHFADKYALKNVVPILHTFSDYPDVDTSGSTCNQLIDQRPIRLVLFGNFNQSNVEATVRLIDAVKTDDRFSISIYTGVPVALLKMRGIDTAAVEHKGYVDDSELIEELQQYDIVVLTHGFTGAYGAVEYRTIFPTRTIPMLLSGKPILVHSPPASFLSSFVTEFDVGVLVDEPTHEAVQQGLECLISDVESTQRRIQNAHRSAHMFHRPVVLNVLREHLGFASAAAGTT